MSEVKALIEPVLFQEVDEVRNASDDSGTEAESGSAEILMAVDDGIDESSTSDASDGNVEEGKGEPEPGQSDERRPLAEVVKLPTAD